MSPCDTTTRHVYFRQLLDDQLLNLISYPLNIFNTMVSFALLVMYIKPSIVGGWSSPFRATLPVTLFFFLANVFLVIVPIIPPSPGNEPYADLPYYLHVVVGFGLVGLGGVYWLIWAVLLPKFGGYTLSRREELGPDGLTRKVFFKIKNE